MGNGADDPDGTDRETALGEFLSARGRYPGLAGMLERERRPEFYVEDGGNGTDEWQRSGAKHGELHRC